MKILVTGGAGFIGSNFLSLLVPRHPEHHFVCVDKLTYAANLESLADVTGAPNFTLERVDIADLQAVVELFDRHPPERIVHFAAESHVDRSILAPSEFVRTNIVGTYNLLEAARSLRAGGLELFHHVSTDEVYGSLGEHGRFSEASTYDPSSPYSASKAASDHLVRAYARTFGLPIKITNCSNNYGPRQFPEKLIPLVILNALEGEPIPVYGQGLNVRDWLYVDDHCEAIWTVIERGRLGETYNVGGDAERTNLDVVRAVCQSVARLAQRDALSLQGLIQFVADRPGHDLRYAVDASKLREQCGWQPRETFESGLDKTVRWYLDNPSWVASVRSGAYRRWIDLNYTRRQGASG